MGNINLVTTISLFPHVHAVSYSVVLLKKWVYLSATPPEFHLEKYIYTLTDVECLSALSQFKIKINRPQLCNFKTGECDFKRPCG